MGKIGEWDYGVGGGGVWRLGGYVLLSSIISYLAYFTRILKLVT